MGRHPTKAADNPFCKARIEAAKYNERLFSKEGAAELLGISVSTLSDYELGITKVVPPDMVLKMSDLYNAPELENYYCRECCPLGSNIPQVVSEPVSCLGIKVFTSASKISKSVETLLEIVQDGRVDETEREEFLRIVGLLNELNQATQSLNVWLEKSGNVPKKEE